MTAEENRAYMAEKQREYRKRNADNPEYRKRKQAADSKYREENKPLISERRRAAYALNPEPAKERAVSYYRSNPDKAKEYREQNSNKRALQARGWRENNEEKVREYEMRYKAENVDMIRERGRLYYGANRDAEIQNGREYRKNNPEKVAASQRDYAKNNPDKIHAKSAKRRAVFKNAFVETVSREKVFERDGGVCGICGQKIDLDFVAPHPLSLSLDHVIPLTKGGTHTYGNVQVAHYGCNSRKGNRPK